MIRYAQFAILIFGLLACGHPNQHVIDLIATHTQKIDENTSIELDFKLIELEYTGNIIAADSLEIIKSYIDIGVLRLSDVSLEIASQWADVAVSLIDDIFEWEIMEQESNRSFDKYIAPMKKDLEVAQSKVAENTAEYHRNNEYFDSGDVTTIQTGLSNELDSRVNTYQRFTANPDSTLGRVYNAVYSIDNPVLNARQTINRYFVLNPEETKILRSIDEYNKTPN